MNRPLKISLLANLALVALVFWLVQHAHVAPESSPAAAFSAIPEASSAPASRQSEAPAATPEPPPKFQWRQLESPDYRTYIANLRDIGCPRQTIRDIIVADVESVYAGRRGQLLRQQMTGTAAAGMNLSQTMQTGLQQLQNEEAALLLALLGPPDGSAAPATNALASEIAPAATTARRSRFHPEPKVALPLVFQDPGPELKLNPAQLAVINDVRESFNQELSGLNLDPASPEYRQAWLKAQREADENMSAMLGSYFALDYQMKAEDHAPPAK